MSKRHFECTVQGQYQSISTHSTQPTLRNYTASFILPSPEAALSIICRHLLAPYLRKNYPDFVRVRTHKLVSMVAHGRTPDTSVLQMSIEDMNISQLSDFCILKQILIDPYKHADFQKVKELVINEWNTKRLVAKEEAKTVEDKNKKEAEALLALNGLPVDDAPLSIQIAPNNAKQPNPQPVVTTLPIAEPDVNVPGAEGGIQSDIGSFFDEPAK